MVGKVYHLNTTEYCGHGIYDSKIKEFQGIYLGRLPIKTSIFLKMDDPEGHIFVARSKKGRIEIYCNTNPILNEMWIVEDDDPGYPIGITVSKPEKDNLNQREKEYLADLIKRKLKKGRML